MTDGRTTQSDLGPIRGQKVRQAFLVKRATAHLRAPTFSTPRRGGSINNPSCMHDRCTDVRTNHPTWRSRSKGSPGFAGKHAPRKPRTSGRRPTYASRRASASTIHHACMTDAWLDVRQHIRTSTRASWRQATQPACHPSAHTALRPCIALDTQTGARPRREHDSRPAILTAALASSRIVNAQYGAQAALMTFQPDGRLARMNAIAPSWLPALHAAALHTILPSVRCSA